jgi:[ribosomal protein S18]-alanine N-acetyltransferase
MSIIDGIEIRQYRNEEEARAAAQVMASGEPWIRGGRTAEDTYRNISNPQAESYVALVDGKVVGIIVLAIAVPLIKGYVAGLAVGAEHRNRGIGAALLRFAEERIFRESPNVFLCVSSYNADAQRFYRRMGYEQIGEIAEYTEPGASELLMRKTKGTWADFEAGKIKS